MDKPKDPYAIPPVKGRWKHLSEEHPDPLKPLFKLKKKKNTGKKEKIQGVKGMPKVYDDSWW